MDNTAIQVPQRDCIEVERLVVDSDAQAALAFINDIGQRISNQKNKSIKNHIDGRQVMKKVQILGTGCPKCKMLYEAAQQAVGDAGVEAEITKVEDINEIMKAGVMMTPALVIDGEVKSVGKVLKPGEITALLQ